MTRHSRRAFIQRGVTGSIGLLTFSIAGCERPATPAEARAAKAPLRTLNASEVATLDALGEILLPGSAAAGLSHFIDHQLSGDPADSMLMIKYLPVTMPFVDFYRSGLRNIDSAVQQQFGKALDVLSAAQGHEFATKLSTSAVEGWNGPPAGLFFFVVRNDAIDTLYGTPAGFEKLNVPYMPHIAPPTAWGE